MATLTYVPKDNPAFDGERIEGLRLQNALQRAKLSRIDGEVVSKRQVTFALGHMLLLLRSQILTIPMLVSSELRGILDPAKAHDVRQRVETAIHHFLTQLAENMEHAVSSEEFLAELERNLAGNGTKDKDTEKLRHDLAKRRRTAKRNKKAAR